MAKKCPCCDKYLALEDVMEAIESVEHSTSPTIECPHCKKEITVHLTIDYIEALD